MRCILDLGLQKTGSKARQQFFASQLHRVLDARALYPSAGRQGVWHRPLYGSLAKGNCVLLDELVKEIEERAGEADLAILSYEELHKLDLQVIRRLKESLPDLTAIVFLRRQDELVCSFHNQLHKSHRIPLRDLEAFEARMLDYDPAYDHEATLERWIGVLGHEALIPVLYDKDVSSVLAFFRAVGLSLDLRDYTEDFPNRAMDAFGLTVLRWVKRLTPDDALLPEIMDEAHRRLASHFVPFADPLDRYSLDLDARRRILAHYDASNEWVRSVFFPKHSSLFAPPETREVLDLAGSQGRELAESIVSTAIKKPG